MDSSSIEAALRQKAGFEVVSNKSKDTQVRLLGRVP